MAVTGNLIWGSQCGGWTDSQVPSVTLAMFQRGTEVQDPIGEGLAIDSHGISEQELTIYDNMHNNSTYNEICFPRTMQDIYINVDDS